MKKIVSAKPAAILISLVSFVLAGCQSGGPTHYTAPEVTGRVLAADTHQPLANVRVQCGGPGQSFGPFGPPKGGQLLIEKAVVRTDADGRFVSPAKTVFALFRQPGWWSVPVAFSRSGYETFQTNYTGSNVTSHSSGGVPVVDAGDIFLKPAAK